MTVDVKVIILGTSNCGKSSLVRRYIEGSYRPESTVTTIGASFYSKKIYLKNRMVSVGIWDTAGAEKFLSLTKHYYRNANLAFVCFDLSDYESFLKVNYWIEEVLREQSDCYIILVGTKADINPSSTSSNISRMNVECLAYPGANEDFAYSNIARNPRDRKKNYKITSEAINRIKKCWDLEYYFETSSKTGLNVEDCFKESLEFYYNKMEQLKSSIASKENISIDYKSTISSTKAKKCCC